MEIVILGIIALVIGWGVQQRKTNRQPQRLRRCPRPSPTEPMSDPLPGDPPVLVTGKARVGPF